ncbi:MAG: DUF3592 domain-containing protein [Clostridium sp.]|nr:DUF3592 domain-containing protein [Clostridium sp.]
MVSILLISIGITFIIYGILLFVHNIKLIKKGLKAEGKVIDFEEEMTSYINDDKKIVYKPVYKPVIRFKDYEGNTRVEKLDNYDDIFRLGEKISIVYSLEDADELEVHAKKNVFLVLSNLICMGIVFIVFGVILTLI